MNTFKDGQKVRHPKYGEGIFNLHHPTNKYSIDFGDIQTLWKDVNDDFYNQLEAVEDLPEVGEYAYFYDAGRKHSVYAIYLGKDENNHKMYKANISGIHMWYENISKTPPKFD